MPGVGQKGGNGARRLRRFRVAQSCDFAEFPSAEKGRTVKRPEGCAPAAAGRGAKHARFLKGVGSGRGQDGGSSQLHGYGLDVPAGIPALQRPDVPIETQ